MDIFCNIFSKSADWYSVSNCWSKHESNFTLRKSRSSNICFFFFLIWFNFFFVLQKTLYFILMKPKSNSEFYAVNTTTLELQNMLRVDVSVANLSRGPIFVNDEYLCLLSSLKEVIEKNKMFKIAVKTSTYLWSGFLMSTGYSDPSLLRSKRNQSNFIAWPYAAKIVSEIFQIVWCRFRRPRKCPLSEQRRNWRRNCVVRLWKRIFVFTNCWWKGRAISYY